MQLTTFPDKFICVCGYMGPRGGIVILFGITQVLSAFLIYHREHAGLTEDLGA